MAEQNYRIVWDRSETFELEITAAELAKLLRVDEYKIAERLRESGVNLHDDLRPALDPMDVIPGTLPSIEEQARVSTDSRRQYVEIHRA